MNLLTIPHCLRSEASSPPGASNCRASIRALCTGIVGSIPLDRPSLHASIDQEVLGQRLKRSDRQPDLSTPSFLNTKTVYLGTRRALPRASRLPASHLTPWTFAPVLTSRYHPSSLIPFQPSFLVTPVETSTPQIQDETLVYLIIFVG